MRLTNPKINLGERMKQPYLANGVGTPGWVRVIIFAIPTRWGN